MINKSAVASSISFDNSSDISSLNPFSSQDVQSAITESVISFIKIVPSSFDNINLDLKTKRYIEIQGTAISVSIITPDPLMLINGHSFEIKNSSANAVLIKDFFSGLITSLASGDYIKLILSNNTSPQGDWIFSKIESGLITITGTSTTTFTTTSSTNVMITGMSVTPQVAGTYLIWFSSCIQIGSSSRIAQVNIYKAGLPVADTQRDQRSASNSWLSTLSTQGIIQVNGLQSIDIRVNISAGSLNVFARNLILLRKGE